MVPTSLRESAFLALTCALTIGLASCAPGEAANAGASDNARASAEGPAYLTVPAETRLTFTVGERVSTDDNKVGDTFTSTLSDAVTEDGRVLLSQGAIGRWIVADADGDRDGQAVLAVRLQSIQDRGKWYPVTASVISSDLETDEKDSKTETAKKIGIGAAAGAILGRIVGGDGDATLKGAGAGAALGTVIALSTRGGSATIPEGSHITVRIDTPITMTDR